jgi:hypothetical protein
MACGARRSDVASLVLADILRLVVFGSAGAAVIAVALSRFVESLMFGLEPHRPVTIAATLVLAVIGLVAGYLLRDARPASIRFWRGAQNDDPSSLIADPRIPESVNPRIDSRIRRSEIRRSGIQGSWIQGSWIQDQGFDDQGFRDHGFRISD